MYLFYNDVFFFILYICVCHHFLGQLKSSDLLQLISDRKVNLVGTLGGQK